MSRALNTFFPEDWLRNAATSVLYRSKQDWVNSREAQKSAHFMRRAWDALGLEAILSVEGKPTVYFKSVDDKDLTAESELHRKFWNQGTATLLVIRDRKKEVRVYSAFATPKKEPISPLDDVRLVETLTLVQSSLTLTEFVRRVETGRIYQDHPTQFSSETGVDRTLLRNLKAASKLLCEGDFKLKPSIAHALLGRLLFTCYLRARGVLSNAYLRREAGISLPGGGQTSLSLLELFKGVSLTETTNILFKIFTAVKRDFNGSLFGKELEGEKSVVKASHMDVLRRFLNGDPLDEGGQLSLGFPIYDFSLIPVETISAIYESFLRAESDTLQEETGSFYTPRHLAELTVDIATDGWTTLLDKKCLDPSSGSGIFLVILFNRMAEEWRARNIRSTNVERALALRQLLCEKFWGVDLNPTACRITCFSLYLALFDQLEPADIWELKKQLETTHDRVLPPLLALPENGFKDTPTPHVLGDNFFAKDLPLPNDFDLIIGNPPWVGRNQNPDPVMEDWLFTERNPYLQLAPKNASKRRAFFFPERQSAHAFMWKIPAHLSGNARACLVLPSKVWMNETDAFQAGWLRRFTVEDVVQLSDYRKIIFVEARCPSVIVRFSPIAPTSFDRVIPYCVPKVDRSEPRHALITVLSDDQKGVRLRDVLSSAAAQRASVVWKQALWGSGRDEALLYRLSQLPMLGDVAGEPDENKRWVKGQGFQPFSEKKFKEDPERYLQNVRPDTKPWWPVGQPFISARNGSIDLLVFPEDAPPVTSVPARVRRNPSEKISKPPLVLITQGFGKAAFCDFSVIFQDSLQSIAARKEEDADLLRFLVSVVTSPLANYFLFHTAANWGSERDKVHFSELLRLPFLLPEQHNDSRFAESIVAKVAKRVREANQRIANCPLVLFSREREVEAAKQEVQPLIFEYYGISKTEKMLIEDTVKLFIPSSTPGSLNAEIPTLDDSSPEERADYSSLLCKTINGWGRGKGLSLSASSYVADELGLGLLVLTKGRAVSSYSEVIAPQKISAAIDALEKSLHQRERKIAYARGFTLFERDCAYVFKPLARRHWTLSAALNDADAMLASMLEGAR